MSRVHFLTIKKGVFVRIIAEGEISKLYVLDKGDIELPKGSKVLGQNGVFQTSSSDIFNIVKKATEVFSGFEKIEEKAKMTKLIPEDIFWIGPRWLYKMWNKSQKEYIILLFWHQDIGFTWCVPKQSGSMASLDYSQTDDEDIRAKTSKGHMLIGTMHNHFGARGTAFASGTDDHDEGKSGTTGVHFTMGYMDAPSVYQCEFHTRLVSGSLKKVIKLGEAVEFENSSAGLPELWDEKVDLKPDWKPAKNICSSNGWSRGSWSMYGQGEEGWGSVEEWEGWNGSSVTVVDPSSGEEYFLDDLNTFADDKEESASYPAYKATYPEISTFSGGDSLLHAIVMANEAQDCIRDSIEDDGQYADPNKFKMIAYDAIMATSKIEELIEEFFRRQAESCEKTSESKK
jgi:hypothetical protein